MKCSVYILTPKDRHVFQGDDLCVGFVIFSSSLWSVDICLKNMMFLSHILCYVAKNLK